MASKAKTKKPTKEAVQDVSGKIADLLIGLVGPKYKTIGKLTDEEKKLSAQFQAATIAANKAMKQLAEELNTGIEKQHKALWSALYKGHKLNPKKNFKIDYDTGELQERL